MVQFVLSTLGRIMDNVEGKEENTSCENQDGRCTFALGFHKLLEGQLLLVIINDLVLLHKDQFPSEG